MSRFTLSPVTMACGVKLWYSHKMCKIKLHTVEEVMKFNPVHTLEIISSRNVCMFISKTKATKKM